jgi:hypothetical protein
MEHIESLNGDANSPSADQLPSPVTLAGSEDRARRWPARLLLWAGWMIPQLVLLGPALVGRTVDIPVDLLAHRSLYLPGPDAAKVSPRHGVELTDLVLCYPESREFFAKEIRAGRLPTWNPNNFAGAPIVGWASPFEVPYYLVPSPITVAWISLLQSLTVGLGMWLVLRRCLHLSYWPAALASWCAPLTGYMTLWHGFSTIGPVCWLLWSIVAIDATVKQPRGWGASGLAVTTALVLLAGHIGIAGLVLLTTGFYAVWQLADAGWQRQWKRLGSATAAIGAGWLLGFAISAVTLLPLMAYVRTGARMDSHAEGFEERPPQGLEALPAIVRPDVYGGDTRANWTRTVNAGFIESSSSAYAGLLAALWLAPLAWSNRKLRSQTLFWTLMVPLTLSWTLNIPGIVELLRSKPLRPLVSLSYNRWTFATSEAILVLAAVGLDSLRVRAPRFGWRWTIPMFVSVFFFFWCVYRLFTVTRKLDAQGFSGYFLIGAALSVMAMVGWIVTFRTGPRARWIRYVLIGLLPLELFAFAWQERRQADMQLYFPRIRILAELAALPQGRIWGVGCLPPNLNQMCGLEDVRGYDAVDPRNYIKLFELACDRERTFFYSYARTLMAVPAATVVDHALKLRPVADLLNVRYLIFREAPREDLTVLLHRDDYWIAENQSALPRAYVPVSAHIASSDDEAIARMSAPDFDPRKTVVIADDLGLPETMRGTASVQYETPTRLRLTANMQTAGLVLLSDLWDSGWRAELDSVECPIQRVDVALRGFRVPAGEHTILCHYDPASLRIGFGITAAGCAVLLVWWTRLWWTKQRWTKQRLE